MEECKLIPSSRLPQVEQLLYYLQNRKSSPVEGRGDKYSAYLFILKISLSFLNIVYAQQLGLIDFKSLADVKQDVIKQGIKI